VHECAGLEESMVVYRVGIVCIRLAGAEALNPCDPNNSKQHLWRVVWHFAYSNFKNSSLEWILSVFVCYQGSTCA
jgi:hypothetical protein